MRFETHRYNWTDASIRASVGAWIVTIGVVLGVAVFSWSQWGEIVDRGITGSIPPSDPAHIGEPPRSASLAHAKALSVSVP